MHLERMLARIVAGYLIAVGLFFGLASIFQLPYIQIEPTAKFRVLGISAVFAALGIGSFFLIRTGKLKKEGESITEVRQEAIEKLKDSELLARIAINEPDAELRHTAKARLKDIKDED